MRIKDYDYRTPGYYFITICTHQRNHYFGYIRSGEMRLSDPGKMVSDLAGSLPNNFANTSIDCYVVMPNHVHLLIGLAVRLEDTAGETNLIDVMHWFKSTTHRRYTDGVQSLGWPGYDGKVWQEGYHDHVVRNDRQLDILREYVASNVARWESDELRSDS
ncbi:MAG: transposase [Thermomicrobiales bacterium]|nr:transposase [Thermomicrobiales bacterium]